MTDEHPGTTNQGTDGGVTGSSAAEASRDPAPELNRLPPPAFPPGSRRRASPTPLRFSAREGAESSFPDDVLISPDDPLRRPEGEPWRQGSAPGTASEAVEESELDPSVEDEEGVVTGIGGETPFYFGSGSLGSWDPEAEIQVVARMLERLARELRQKGGTALLINPDSPPLESTLRGLLAGFLLRGEPRG